MTHQPVHFVTAEEWRSWLDANHATETEVWLMIYKKHAATPSVTVGEAVDEALCFGWIDSFMRPIDDERYSLRFSPRRKGSNWSERNKIRAAELIEQGRMTDAGLAKIDEAKERGGWE